MNAADRRLAKSVRESIDHATPGGYNPPPDYRVWLIAGAYAVGGIVLLVIVAVMS